MSDDHSEHDGHGETSPLLQAKIALLCIIGFTTLASALTPWFASGFLATRKALDFIRVAAAASAGVVVGTLLCHLLPHASEAFSAYLMVAYPGADPHGHGDDHSDEDAEAMFNATGSGARRLGGEVLETNAQRIVHYPWAHMVCGAMLFALLVIDFAFAHGLGGHSHGHGHGHSHGHGVGGSHDHVTGGVVALQEAKAAADANAQKAPAEAGGPAATVAIAVAPSPAPIPAPAVAVSDSDSAAKGTIVDAATGTAGTAGTAAAISDPSPMPPAGATASSSTGITMAPFQLEMAAGDVDVDGDPDMQAPSTCGQGCVAALGCGRTARSHKMALLVGQTAGSQQQLRVRAWVFALAMCVHAIFDGLGVGVLASAGGFSSLFVAVFVHKLFDGLSLGSTVFLGDLPACQRWFLLLITSALTPIGIGIGIAVVETLAQQALELATGIILSLSAGSFAFIGLIELLPSALADGRKIPLKLSVFGLGYLVMAIIGAWA